MQLKSWTEVIRDAANVEAIQPIVERIAHDDKTHRAAKDAYVAGTRIKQSLRNDSARETLGRLVRDERLHSEMSSLLRSVGKAVDSSVVAERRKRKRRMKMRTLFAAIGAGIAGAAAWRMWRRPNVEATFDNTAAPSAADGSVTAGVR